jgi:hypothetical protein
MADSHPNIFTLISCPIIGELGPDTEIVELQPCPECGQEYRPFISFLDYRLDVWEAAELIMVADVYAITRRLFEALQQAGLKGCSTRPMKTSRSALFDQIDPDKKVLVPEFLQLWIDDTANGPSGWWERGPICAVCGRVIWKHTNRVIEAYFAKYSGKPGPPRLVSAATWKGSDIFVLTDPGPPVVTDRFKQFAENQKVLELVFAPASWVD